MALGWRWVGGVGGLVVAWWGSPGRDLDDHGVVLVY